MPPRVLCVGTHHKTGTVWMRHVFRAISERLNIPMIAVHRPRKWERIPKEGRVIVANWGGKFAPELRAMPDAVLLHLIRDPRDVLLSGARYHETTAMRTERFLYDPRDDLGGRSYQQHLQSLPSTEDKLAFEMAEMHLRTLKEMLAWDRTHLRSTELRYEDLIDDTDCTLFGDMLRRFGFSDAEVTVGCEAFVEHSLFGGLAKGTEGSRAAKHVKSGKAAQWVTKLPPETAALYLQRHGDDLITLGYEADKGWLSRLRYQPGSKEA